VENIRDKIKLAKGMLHLYFSQFFFSFLFLFLFHSTSLKKIELKMGKDINKTLNSHLVHTNRLFSPWQQQQDNRQFGLSGKNGAAFEVKIYYKMHFQIYLHNEY
jgi:hypothetical protein